MNNIVKIVIIGNGFGGTYTLKHLQKLFKNDPRVHITLVGETNYFLFTPLLHEVATGSINPENIIEPIRKVFRSCLDDFHLGNAESVNLKEQKVKIINNGDITTIPYDYLVLASGAETNFFSTKGAEEHSLTLKTLADAIKIKNRAISQIEKASHIENEALRKKMLNFVVVGGGPTGVELASELIELLRDSFSSYYHGNIIKDTAVTLVQRGDELLPQFNKKIRQKSLEVLRKKGINVLLKTGVVEVAENKVVLDNGNVIETENTIWVAGIKPRTVEFDESVPMLEDGRIIVNENLQIENHNEVFVLGDIAGVRVGNSGTFLPALAQVAVKEAGAVSNNIARLIKGKGLKPFIYKSRGTMVSLGQWMAIGEISNFAFWGHITWWLWRTVYLSKMISWQKKIKIAIDWTINLFSPRDISQL